MGRESFLCLREKGAEVMVLSDARTGQSGAGKRVSASLGSRGSWAGIERGRKAKIGRLRLFAFGEAAGRRWT